MLCKNGLTDRGLVCHRDTVFRPAAAAAAVAQPERFLIAAVGGR